MPVRYRLLLSLGVLTLLAGVAPPAWATIDNLKSYKQAYPGQDAKAYSCKVCHDGVMGNKDNLNARGKTLKQFKADQGAKKLTAEDYQAFDAADSDKDGATNAQELKAGTDPFDPASRPPAVSTAPAAVPGVQTVKKDDVGTRTGTPPTATKPTGEGKQTGPQHGEEGVK